LKHWSEVLPLHQVQRRVVRMPPTAVLALLFAGLIGAGTLLLMLPVSRNAALHPLDAMFTAASAVTVTGLVVVDTGTHFTRFGQVVLLLLMQLGGLGIITFAVMILALLGQRLGLRQQMLLKEDLNQTSLGDLVRLVRVIAVVVGLTEGAGMLLLALRFVPQYGWGEGLFQALFHAVSAFNNAGFSLFPDGLVRYSNDAWVAAAVMVLVVVGSLGFSVVDELRQRGQRRRLSLHTQLTLLGTAVLVVWSIAALAVMEWHNPQTLARHEGTGERLLAAAFQAVAGRTAGLNNVDVGHMGHASTLMFISLMFIGGGSTSAAGGIKVSSFMVLCIATLAFLRGSTSPTAFGRTIAASDILKVLALTFLSLLMVMVAAFALALTHPELPFADLLFEAVSAFSTCGLSRGITAQLDGWGRAILIVVMFLGRIGPLALGLAFARSAPPAIRYPQGRVYLG
jgi:trk system potassium uptake protein TrkH